MENGKSTCFITYFRCGMDVFFRENKTTSGCVPKDAISVNGPAKNIVANLTFWYLMRCWSLVRYRARAVRYFSKSAKTKEICSSETGVCVRVLAGTGLRVLALGKSYLKYGKEILTAIARRTSKFLVAVCTLSKLISEFYGNSDIFFEQNVSFSLSKLFLWQCF